MSVKISSLKTHGGWLMPYGLWFAILLSFPFYPITYPILHWVPFFFSFTHDDIVLVCLHGLLDSGIWCHKDLHRPDRCHQATRKEVSRHISVCYHLWWHHFGLGIQQDCLPSRHRGRSCHWQQLGYTEAALWPGGKIHDTHACLQYTLVSLLNEIENYGSRIIILSVFCVNIYRAHSSTDNSTGGLTDFGRVSRHANVPNSILTKPCQSFVCPRKLLGKWTILGCWWISLTSTTTPWWMCWTPL